MNTASGYRARIPGSQKRHVLLIISLIWTMLASCGSSNQPSTEQYAVHIVRNGAFSHMPPIDQMFTQSSEVQQLYKESLSLSPYPTIQGIHSCFVDEGSIYTLTFYLNGKDILDATAHSGGCQILERAGNGYQTTGTFWYLLKQITGQPI